MRLLFFKTFQTNKLSSQPSQNSSISFGPFNLFNQKRWKKPANTAQTRLENRTRDLKLDLLTSQLRKLNIAHHLFDIMSRRRRPYVLMQVMARWVNIVGLNVKMGEFVNKYPHAFEVFKHPVRRNVCCSVASEMRALIEEERFIVREREADNVRLLKKIFMMSKEGTLHLHALRLVRRELGLPEDFRESILGKYSDDFKLVDMEVVALVKRDENLASAKIEGWRANEYREKWLSEFEIRYAFPINFSTGFKIMSGFKEKLMNWQRLSYVKPYEKEGRRSRTKAGIERFEKRVVGVVHELLSLTVEKMLPVERFAHFRKDLGIEVNMRELLLKHPGIFYISTKGNNQTVFLREAYTKGCLNEHNDLYIVRRKMLDLMLLRRRHTRKMKQDKVIKEEKPIVETEKVVTSRRDGDWIFPFLGRSDD